MEHFIELFESLNPAQKNEFLLRKLQSDDILKREFLFAFKHEYDELRRGLSGKLQLETVLKEIQRNAEMYRNEIEKIDFSDLDWANAPYRSYYVADYEIAAELSEEIADELLNPWLQQLKDNMALNGFVEVIAHATTLFLASTTAKVHDPDENLGSRDYFTEKVQSAIEAGLPALVERQYLEFELKQGFELLLLANQRYFDRKSGLLVLIEKMLLQLMANKQQVALFDKVLEQYPVDMTIVPRLARHIALILGDDDRRLEALKAGFGNDYEMSVEWMDHLYAAAAADFDEWAEKFNKTYNQFAPKYLRDKVSKGSVLHLELLKSCVKLHSDYEAYVALKVWLNEGELEALMAEMHSTDSRAKFYALEKKYDKLEQHVIRELAVVQPFYHFDYRKALTYFLPEHPERAWKLAQTIVETKMKLERNRQGYALIAGVLKDMWAIAPFQAEVGRLIQHLYMHKPTLPALKDEFRKAGVIRSFKA